MKIFRRILPAAFFCAALSLPLFAQEEEGADNSEPQQETQAAQPPAETPKAPAKKAQPKKSAAKKKAAKKKTAVSEYKFTNDTPTPTYKFDKKSDPIVKEPKKKKKAAKKGSSDPSSAMPRLKKVKSFNEPNADGTKPEGANVPDGN